ncbi:uncharacterized protein [Euphorbia lathyris]|uniref:uncharacterized protein isoform X6 n=1 Tax=Euphorbia lathyris TaxID=212925 RepID=UPI0033130CBE
MKFLSSKAMQKLLTSQLKILLLHGFKLHLGTTRAFLTMAEFLLKLVFLTLKHWTGKYMREAQNVSLVFDNIEEEGPQRGGTPYTILILAVTISTLLELLCICRLTRI